LNLSVDCQGAHKQEAFEGVRAGVYIAVSWTDEHTVWDTDYG